jgi:hypothetical protein
MHVEDFQEQEYEFLRRLDEERIDRRRLIKRGLVAGVGLTVLTTPAAALAARRKALADPPTSSYATETSTSPRRNTSSHLPTASGSTWSNKLSRRLARMRPRRRARGQPVVAVFWRRL